MAYQAPTVMAPANQRQPLPNVPPQKPGRKSESMPDPASVEHQKREYGRVLDVELQQGQDVIQQKLNETKAQLAQQAESAKNQYAITLQQDLLSKDLAWEKQTEQQILALHEAHMQQKTHLEQQSSKLVLDFKQKEMQDVLALRKYELQVKQYQHGMEAQQLSQVLAQAAQNPDIARQFLAQERQAAQQGPNGAAPPGQYQGPPQQPPQGHQSPQGQHSPHDQSSQGQYSPQKQSPHGGPAPGERLGR